jgi:hypothetical protein
MPAGIRIDEAADQPRTSYAVDTGVTRVKKAIGRCSIVQMVQRSRDVFVTTPSAWGTGGAP